MVTDLGTTNVWLAVMAFAAVLQSAMMFVVALVALRLLRRMEDALARVERRDRARGCAPLCRARRHSWAQRGGSAGSPVRARHRQSNQQRHASGAGARARPIPAGAPGRARGERDRFGCARQAQPREHRTMRIAGRSRISSRRARLHRPSNDLFRGYVRYRHAAEAAGLRLPGRDTRSRGPTGWSRSIRTPRAAGGGDSGDGRIGVSLREKRGNAASCSTRHPGPPARSGPGSAGRRRREHHPSPPRRQ